MNSFKVGDKVVYPNQGLGVIVDIQQQDFNGEKFKIYHLKILSNNTLVMIPSSNAEEMGIRKPVTEQTIKEIFDLMKNGEVDVSMNWKGRYKEHINLMKSGTIIDLVYVMKSLFYLSMMKTLSFREKKMMEKAKELIISELSEVSSLTSAEIEKKILRSLTYSYKTSKPNLEV
jgi:CarD family transcriptional regulator